MMSMKISMSDFFSDKGPQIAGVMLVVGIIAAWLASRRNDNRRKEQKKAEHITAVNEAIQTISSVWNSLSLYRKETIDPALSSKDPWLDMQAQVDSQFETINFPEEKLMFLLRTEYADLFAEYLAEERRYLALMGLIRERSKLVLETLRPKMEKLGYKPGKSFDINKVEQDLGQSLTTKLKELTDGIAKHTNESIESLENFYHRFRKDMTEHLDGEKILEVEFEK